MSDDSQSCPSGERWRCLLAGGLAETDEAALTSHLSACPACQKLLDSIAAGTDALQAVAREVGADDPTLVGLGRHAARAEVGPTGSLGFGPAPPARPHDAIFPFLRPAERPGSLGRLGHYEVLEVLGRGGFGIVLRAFDESLHRVVALKVLAPEMAETSPARKRFLREARASAPIRHENVVRVFAIEEEPLPYIVMEYIPGETLQGMINRIGPLDTGDVVRIGTQIARGLAAAHDLGLVHRDIKPGNILLEDGVDRLVKVTDFGLARTADDASLTQSGAVMGTPAYMAPEQARGERTDHRADLFSLGSVLYSMVTGRPPFRAETTFAVMKRVAEDTPRSIPEIIPEAPDWLCDIIAKLMEKERDDRIQTAREVAELLAASQPAPPRPAKRPARSGPRALRLALAGAAAVCASLLALGVYLATRPNPQPHPQEPDSSKPEPPLVHRPIKGGFQLSGPGIAGWPAASEDGKLLAVPWGDTVWLFEVPTGKLVRTLSSPRGRVRHVAISAKGRLLAAVSETPEPVRLRVWDLDTFEELFTQDTRGWNVTFSPDGTQVVAFPDEVGSRFRILKARTGEEVTTLPGGRRARARFNAAGTLLAICTEDGLSVWDTKMWKQIHAGERPPGCCRDLHFSPDGALLAVASSDRIDLWNVPTFDRAGGFAMNCYWWFDFTPDGKSIVAASTHDAMTTHVLTQWDLERKELRRQIEVRFPIKTHINSALSFGGRAVYVVDEPAKRVRVFDVATGEEVLP
jgi:serine/threonine protein kinase